MRALTRLGISDIAVATDGKSGLKLFESMVACPDVIVCDIFMPEKDGIEIVNALAERSYRGGVIFASSGDEQFLKIATTMAIKAGLNVLGSLTKPLRDEALQSCLERQDKTILCDTNR